MLDVDAQGGRARGLPPAEAADDRTPVLMLTARLHRRPGAGLDAGADDYLVKPFALEELHARLRALLRRTSSTEAARSASPT